MLEKIRDPEWLISVVLVGILCSLVAAYIKGWLDRWFPRYLNRLRRQRDETQQAARARVELMVGNPQLQTLQALRALAGLARAMSLAIFVGLCWPLITVFPESARGLQPALAGMTLLSLFLLAVIWETNRDAWGDVWRAHLVDRGEMDLDGNKLTKR